MYPTNLLCFIRRFSFSQIVQVINLKTISNISKAFLKVHSRNRRRLNHSHDDILNSSSIPAAILEITILISKTTSAHRQ